MQSFASVARRNESLRLNVSDELLQEFNGIVDEMNRDFHRHPGTPRLEIATTAKQLRATAVLLAATFARSRDRSWIAWLPRRQLDQIKCGDFTGSERKLARIIGYLLSSALISGGIIVLETADGENVGQRVMRGAVLRKLPPATRDKESLLRRYLLGAGLALQSYGIRRALAADRAARELDQAMELSIARHRIPDRCVRGGMLAVFPPYQGLGVSSRLCAPFHELADRNGLWSVIQSSSPEHNDDRVFRRWGFDPIGQHHYGPSPCNGVGPYALNILARKPNAHGNNVKTGT
jgi:GNAT superfamily N-acetyltransferase